MYPKTMHSKTMHSTKFTKKNPKRKYISKKYNKAQHDAWDYIQYLKWCYMNSPNISEAFKNAELAYKLCMSNACAGDYNSLIQLGIWSATGFIDDSNTNAAKLAFEKAKRVLIEECQNDGLNMAEIQNLIDTSHATYFLKLYNL